MTDFSNEMHLGQDEIDEARIGCLADAASGHLDACAVCQQRVTAARLPIEDFKAVTMAWSERRSATMPTSLSTRLLESASRQRRLAWRRSTLLRQFRPAKRVVTVAKRLARIFGIWLRGLDLNQRPLGYEPNELPDCSTPRT